MMTLVEDADDETQYVSPSTDGERDTTVTDRLDALESDGPRTLEAPT